MKLIHFLSGVYLVLSLTAIIAESDEDQRLIVYRLRNGGHHRWIRMKRKDKDKDTDKPHKGKHSKSRTTTKPKSTSRSRTRSPDPYSRQPTHKPSDDEYPKQPAQNPGYNPAPTLYPKQTYHYPDHLYPDQSGSGYKSPAQPGYNPAPSGPFQTYPQQSSHNYPPNSGYNSPGQSGSGYPSQHGFYVPQPSYNQPSQTGYNPPGYPGQSGYNVPAQPNYNYPDQHNYNHPDHSKPQKPNHNKPFKGHKHNNKIKIQPGVKVKIDIDDDSNEDWSGLDEFGQRVIQDVAPEVIGGQMAAVVGAYPVYKTLGRMVNLTEPGYYGYYNGYMFVVCDRPNLIETEPMTNVSYIPWTLNYDNRCEYFDSEPPQIHPYFYADPNNIRDSNAAFQVASSFFTVISVLTVLGI